MNKTFNDKLANVMRYLKSGRAVTSLIVVIVSFCMMVVTSVAWLTTNRRLKSEEMGMGLTVDDTSAIYKAYMYDLDSMKGVDKLKGENGEDEELNIANLKMNQYDTIFVVQNKYTPAFAQIQISGNSFMPASGTIFITIYRDSTISPFDDKDKLSERISSVLRFTAIIDSSQDDFTMTNADDLYNYINPETRFNEIREYKGELDNSKTFVTAHGEGDGHTHEKTDTITVSMNYTEKNWYTDEDGNQKLNIYLYMSYDVQLIDCFIKEHTNDRIALDDTTYDFENDLKNVSVSYTPSN